MEPKTATHHNMGLTGEVAVTQGLQQIPPWIQLGQPSIQQGLRPLVVTIPMAPEDWKKLSRDTQLRMLDELGILNPKLG